MPFSLAFPLTPSTFPALLPSSSHYFPSQLGFFKRRYKEMMDDKPEDATMFSGEAPREPLS